MDRDDTSHFQRRIDSTGIETVSDIVLIDSTAYEKDTIDTDMDTRREIPISIVGHMELITHSPKRRYR